MSKKQLMAEIEHRLNGVSPNSDGVRVVSVGKTSLEVALKFGNVASRDEIAQSIRSKCDEKGIVPND
ncbi:hypothetical protein P7F60_11955 [Rhizobium sp. YJ-22]|uniref:hypothetical protein n=1 Tax=Rhizobium sp. YJ-22 TaxID=3037556 RepID=UPI0024121EBD|nr:hypothetical protein [Rhizobium sp. YJ-22]MDG3577106.1 hypothetical protein [Rhizobium sp. YJ-22]